LPNWQIGKLPIFSFFLLILFDSYSILLCAFFARNFFQRSASLFVRVHFMASPPTSAQKAKQKERGPNVHDVEIATFGNITGLTSFSVFLYVDVHFLLLFIAILLQFA